MPRRSEDVIEFEDLRGNPDPDHDDLEVDLDHDSASKGISRSSPRIKPDDDGALDDEFDDLHGNRPDDRADGKQERKTGRSGNDFEARLEREKEARKRERERADAAERRAAEAEARLKDHRKQESKQTLESLDARVAETEVQLEAAMEREDTKAQVKLTSQLTDLKARRIAMDYVTPEGDDEPTVPVKAEANPHLSRFLSGHDDWYKRPGFERQTRLLYRLDKEVHADGYDPKDPDYFEELNRRLRDKAPEVFDDGEGDDSRTARGRGRDREQDPRDTRRSPVMGSDRDVDGRTRTAGRSSRVTLTREDYANMRTYGLDPSDPEVLKEYARNKRQAAEDAR